MDIRYFDVLSNGWNIMKQSLFSKPFNLDKWFAIGFTAFLANLVSGSSGGGGSNSFRKNYNDNLSFGDVFTFPQIAYEWLGTHQLWLWLIIFGVVLIIAIVIVLTWLSSRGQFMFLHNVVYDKDDVKIPWNEYRKEGDSLFLWRLVYGAIVFFISIFIIFYGFTFAKNAYMNDFSFSDKVFTILSLVGMFGLLAIITAYISLFLKDFIVPIMFKHRLTTTQAWSFFLPTLKSNVFHFLLYGIFILFLWLVAVAAIIAFGLVTCCLGFLIMIIPYIGTVLLLPVYYTFRALSVRFLEQFGDEFSLFPKESGGDKDAVTLK